MIISGYADTAGTGFKVLQSVELSWLKRTGGGRIAAHEIMLCTPAIRTLIREDKVAQMYSAIQTGGSMGMSTLDQTLVGLLDKNLITKEQAREKAKSPEDFV